MLFLPALLLASCSVNQHITLLEDGSGGMEGTVHMESFFLNTLEDLTDLGAGGKDQLNPDTIAAEIARNPVFSGVKVSSPAEGEYRGSLSFRHIDDIFQSAETSGAGSLLAYKELGSGEKQLDITITPENFEQLFLLFPLLKDPGFQYFLPDGGISEAEYIDALVFIFDGNNGMDANILRPLIRKASLELLISVDGTITAQEGGEKVDASTMRISLPLVRLLLHNEEIHYSLRYKV